LLICTGKSGSLNGRAGGEYEISGPGLDLKSVDRLFEAFYTNYQGPGPWGVGFGHLSLDHRGARRADLGRRRMNLGGAVFQFTPCPLEPRRSPFPAWA